ncbi:serine/threonine-protein kinase [Streptomyces sp. NBC_01304]|uniref:serine/threonine-protein kinase n=1 Tax=Streptomyces sp. NBC_01304 TaxID=2903818 RepID=UPI002E11DA2A|nr:serine/threonine-protein kinase [Streptomyces sp. NBC_01304]
MRLRGGDPEAIGGYPLEARLGAGGMGTVYLARTASGRPVAIKLIHQHFADDEEFRTRFRQEISAARRVSGAFTAAVVDADPEAEHPWMATTFIEGPTLAQRIADEGPLGGAELRMLAVGLAEALRDIHRAGVVHRDLKPSNVVLSPEGPRVIDFGISRAADNQTLTMTGRVIGTPPFMSPEQLQAPRDVGSGSDVFSLATLLVYAATGQGPFDADSPYMTAYQVVHEAPALGAVPAVLRTVVEPCLTKDPASRPSAGQLLTQLMELPDDFGRAEPATTGGPALDTQTRALSPRTAAKDSPTQGVGRRLRRRWRSVLAAAVAVAAIGGGVAILQAGPGEQAPTDNSRQTVATSGKGRLPSGFHPWQDTVRGKQELTDELRCAASGGDLYCGGGGLAAARLKASDGSTVWKVDSPGVPVQGMHLAGLTGAAKGAGPVVVGYRQRAGGAPIEVVAVSADGKVLWSAPIGLDSILYLGQSLDAVLLPRGKEGTAGTAGTASKAGEDGTADVLSVDAAHTHIESRRARSGKTVWRTPFPAGTQCAPYVAGTHAYAVCAPLAEVQGTEVLHPVVHTIDAKTGKLGKGVRFDGRMKPVGAAQGRLVLVQQRWKDAAFDHYDKVALLDPRTGKVTAHPLRTSAASTPGLRAGGAPVVADGTLYFTGPGGRVNAVDPASGKEKWSRQTGAEWLSAPTLADGVLYFASASGRVVALEAPGGKPLWTTDTRVDGLGGDAGVSARVTVAGRAVIVSADGNTLFGFDAGKPPKPE